MCNTVRRTPSREFFPVNEASVILQSFAVFVINLSVLWFSYGGLKETADGLNRSLKKKYKLGILVIAKPLEQTRQRRDVCSLRGLFKIFRLYCLQNAMECFLVLKSKSASPATQRNKLKWVNKGIA